MQVVVGLEPVIESKLSKPRAAAGMARPGCKGRFTLWFGASAGDRNGLNAVLRA